MKIFMLISTLCLSCYAFPSFAQQYLPLEVEKFIKARDVCDHLRGEIPDNPTDADIERINVACRGTDRVLNGLYKKYGGCKNVMDELGKYERDIEAVD